MLISGSKFCREGATLRKSVLKSTIATGVCVMAAALAIPAFADAPKPVKVSPEFKDNAHVVATKTVKVVETGTPGPEVVSCPEGAESSDNWQQVPVELRKVARPGQCFSRLLLSPKAETFRDHVMIADARTETRIVPEEARVVVKDVMVSAERTGQKVIPAVTHVEMATEVVRPASFREDTIPARYETRVEHVMVQPERKVWVRSEGIATGAALITPIDHEPVRYRADGTLNWPGKTPQTVAVSDSTAEYLQQGSGQDVWCLKILPSVYEDRQTRVEVEPASVRRVEIPAVTRQVRRTVVDQPEHVETFTIPAAYEKRKVREVVTPARTETYTVPAVYQDVEKTRISGEATPVWREVLCNKNATPQKIMEIQRALAARGYQPGAIDGTLGRGTVSAMQKFQADNGLAQGQMSVEAVNALGVRLN